MNSRISRRNILRTVGAAALLGPSPRGADLPVLRQEGTDTPLRNQDRFVVDLSA